MARKNKVINLLKNGVEFLAKTMKANASEIVCYKRGLNSVDIPATLGKTNYQIEDESGFKIGGQITDFLFEAADLIIDGLLTVPKTGDRIEIGGRTYEALFINDGCWRYSDPYHKLIRFHTKEI